MIFDMATATSIRSLRDSLELTAGEMDKHKALLKQLQADCMSVTQCMNQLHIPGTHYCSICSLSWATNDSFR